MNHHKYNNLKTPRCSKGGVKIHQSDNDCKYGYNDIQNLKNDTKDDTEYDEQLEFYNKIKSQNRYTGVRIENSENNYSIDPFDGINPFQNPQGEKEVNVTYNKVGYDSLDLNINNYSQNDLYKLFGIDTQMLTEDIMRVAKKIVLKTHPDKCSLDQKYFLFFSKAYKRLFGIYEFQNKSRKKVEDNNEYYDSNNNIILDKMFDKNKHLKENENFNEWFNEKFEKHKLDDEKDTGYGDWLKSNEDIHDVGNISQSNIGREIEKRKKQIQALSTYNGVNTQYASTFGGTSLIEHNNNYNSSGLFSNEGVGYTDLKQAYVESVIPITEEDYHKMPKFKNIDEYNRYRNSVDSKPLDKEEALKQLYASKKQEEEESVALAYYYAKQNEKANQNNQQFWSSIKQLM